MRGTSKISGERDDLEGSHGSSGPLSRTARLPCAWLVGALCVSCVPEELRVVPRAHKIRTRHPLATRQPPDQEERRSAAGGVNGISHLRSMAYGVTALSTTSADRLLQARMALRNQPWLSPGVAKSRGVSTEQRRRGNSRGRAAGRTQGRPAAYKARQSVTDERGRPIPSSERSFERYRASHLVVIQQVGQSATPMPHRFD